MEQASAFRARVLGETESRRAWSPDGARELARYTDLYVARQGAYPVRGRDECLGLFGNAGIEVNRLSWGPIAGDARHEVSGPGIPGAGEYGRIVAVRR